MDWQYRSGVKWGHAILSIQFTMSLSWKPLPNINIFSTPDIDCLDVPVIIKEYSPISSVWIVDVNDLRMFTWPYLQLEISFTKEQQWSISGWYLRSKTLESEIVIDGIVLPGCHHFRNNPFLDVIYNIFGFIYKTQVVWAI